MEGGKLVILNVHKLGSGDLEGGQGRDGLSHLFLFTHSIIFITQGDTREQSPCPSGSFCLLETHN